MDHRRGSSCTSPWLPSLLRSLFCLVHSMFLPAARHYISAHSCYCVQYKSTAWFCFPCLPVGSVHHFLKKIVHVWVSSILNLKKIGDTQTRIGLHVYARFGLIHPSLKKITYLCLGITSIFISKRWMIPHTCFKLMLCTFWPNPSFFKRSSIFIKKKMDDNPYTLWTHVMHILASSLFFSKRDHPCLGIIHLHKKLMDNAAHNPKPF